MAEQYWAWQKGRSRLRTGKPRWQAEPPTGYVVLPKDKARVAVQKRSTTPKAKPDNGTGSELRSAIQHTRDDRVIRAVKGEPQYDATGRIIGYDNPQRNRTGMAKYLTGVRYCTLHKGHHANKCPICNGAFLPAE